MGELWTRISSATAANKYITDIELEIILASRLFAGIRVNIGMSADIAVDPYNADLMYINYILRRLATAGLKVLLGLGGEGPPNAGNAEWADLNGGFGWNSVKRPSLGDPPGVIPEQYAEIKSAAIASMVAIYKSVGLDPYEYCFVELGNEPAIGGAGAPPPDDGVTYTFYAQSGINYSSSIGLWDKQSDYTGGSWNSTKGASFLEFFTIEFAELETLGLRCVTPTFAAKNLNTGASSELQTFDRAATSGKKWLDVAKTPGQFIFGLNNYYNGFNDGAATLNKDMFTWPTCGPHRYAEMAVLGRDRRGVKSNDDQCALARIALMRTVARIANARIAIIETGVTPRFLGMTDDPDGEVIGDRDQTNFVNFQICGEATLALVDLLLKHATPWVVHFSASDAITAYGGSTAWKELWGFFKSTATVSAVPSPANELTYSTALAWLRRAGLPTTSPDTSIASADRATFWGEEFRKGEDEDVF